MLLMLLIPRINSRKNLTSNRKDHGQIFEYYPLESSSSRQARNQTSKSQNRVEEERSVIRARLIEPRRGTQRGCRVGGWGHYVIQI